LWSFISCYSYELTWYKYNLEKVTKRLKYYKYGKLYFIVVYNLDGDFILSLDPSNGKRIMSKKEFYGVWNKDDKGYVLVVLPTNNKKLKNIDYNTLNNFKR